MHWIYLICVHWIYLIHKFHNLSWITEINELFHDILIYWDAPVYRKEDLFPKINIYLTWIDMEQHKYAR